MSRVLMEGTASDLTSPVQTQTLIGRAMARLCSGGGERPDAARSEEVAIPNATGETPPVATPTIATESDYAEWLAERDRRIASYTRPPNDGDPPPTLAPPPVTSPLGAALARHREGDCIQQPDEAADRKACLYLHRHKESEIIESASGDGQCRSGNRTTCGRSATCLSDRRC